jgi:hypothetical protein
MSIDNKLIDNLLKDYQTPEEVKQPESMIYLYSQFILELFCAKEAETKMKHCPSCQRTYADDSLTFCLEDGTALLSASSGSTDPAATLIMSDPRATSPARAETYRPQPPPMRPAQPPPYNRPQPAWSPVMPPYTYPAATARQGQRTSHHFAHLRHRCLLHADTLSRSGRE